MLPEALLDHNDFTQWRKDNDRAGSVLYPSSREEFEAWSGQAWTHLLMQVIKVRGGDFFLEGGGGVCVKRFGRCIVTTGARGGASRVGVHSAGRGEEGMGRWWVKCVNKGRGRTQFS